MKKLLSPKHLFLVFIFWTHLSAQYVSPGVRLGYDFNNHLIFGIKLSVGAYQDGSFINLTFGKKFLIGSSNTLPYSNYNYIDLQMGQLTAPIGGRKVQIFYGGGLGLIFFKGHWAPRITTFAGNLLFATLDFNFVKQKNPHSDLGLQLVLPIPLNSNLLK